MCVRHNGPIRVTVHRAFAPRALTTGRTKGTGPVVAKVAITAVAGDQVAAVSTVQAVVALGRVK